MSTKIYNGYKFNKPMSLINLQEFAMDLRKKITAVNEDLVPQYFAELCCNSYDSLKLDRTSPEKMKKEFERYGVKKQSSLYFGLYFMLQEACKKENRTIMDDILTFECSIVFLPISRSKTLAMFYSEIPQHKDVFESYDCIEEYVYFNNTDRPDEISSREWSQRCKDWDKALPGIGIPNLNGFLTKCSDEAITYIIGKCKEIEKFMPDYDTRCHKHAKQIVLQEKYEELREHNKDNYYKCAREADKFIKTDEGHKTVEEKIKWVKTILPDKITVKMLMDENLNAGFSNIM